MTIILATVHLKCPETGEQVQLARHRLALKEGQKENNPNVEAEK